MFREIILPFFRSTRLCVTAYGIMHPPRWRPATSWGVHYSAPEDGQINFPKHVELTGIINKPLLLRLVGCLYYLYQWYTVMQISDNEVYLLIKFIKRILWKVAKRLSYMPDARCLKVKYFTASGSADSIICCAVTDDSSCSALFRTALTRKFFLAS